MKLNVKSPVYVIVFAAVVSAAFTAAISVLAVATEDRVERNERLKLQESVVELFKLGDVAVMTDAELVAMYENRIEEQAVTDPQTGDELTLYRAYDSDGTHDASTLIGVAVPVAGQGFWARIEGLLALTPDYETITGVVFLEQKETPGLGGRITENDFRRRFEPEWRESNDQPPLTAAPPRPGGQFIYVGGGEPSGPSDPRYGRTVDAITGATQTSLRVGDLINDSLEKFYRAVGDDGRQADNAAGGA